MQAVGHRPARRELVVVLVGDDADEVTLELLDPAGCSVDHASCTRLPRAENQGAAGDNKGHDYERDGPVRPGGASYPLESGHLRVPGDPFTPATIWSGSRQIGGRL